MAKLLRSLWIEDILCNPYHRCGALMARGAVCIATLMWSCVVLIEKDSLSVTRYGPVLTQYIPEDVLALFLGGLALCMFLRLIYKVPPNPIGIVAYLILATFWLFADIMILSVRPWQPTATGWVTTGVILAAFALVSNPRRQK